MSRASECRITELYEGQIGTPAEQRLLAARVRWMISQVDGNDMLDVGCGQGLAALLLAREGRRAIGVDREPTMIEWARRRAELEQQAVQDRLTYDVREAADLRFGDASFDAVLLGAVLEEQIDPGPVAAEARRVLKLGGRLVITALYGELRSPPFGEAIHLKGLVDLLAQRGVEIREVAMLDRFIAISGVAAAAGAIEPSANVLASALSATERKLAELLDRSVQRGSELEEGERRRRQLERSVKEARVERDEARERADARATQLARTREQLAASEAERDGLQRACEQAEQRLGLSEGRRRELEAEIGTQLALAARLEGELTAVHALKAPFTGGHGRLAQLERECSALRDEAQRASAQSVSLEAERRAIAAELTSATTEVAHLEQELAHAREAASAARRESASTKIEAELARRDAAELAETVERLKGRIVAQAERISAAEEQLAATEADHKRLDQRWRHATDRADQLEQELAGAVFGPPSRAEARAQAPDVVQPVIEPPATGSRTARARRTKASRPRVLHLLVQSVPHSSSPIAAHRHGLLLAQRGAGLDPSAMTDLDFPWDLGVSDPPDCDLVDGVAYYRLRDGGQPSHVDRLSSAIRIGEELLALLRPHTIHAASIEVAPLAVELATRNSLRSIVELATEVTAPAELDIELLSRVDHVVALSNAQQARALTAGVSADQLEVIPAFVDTSRFPSSNASTPGNGHASPVVGVVAYRPDTAAIAALVEAVGTLRQPVRGVIADISSAAAGFRSGRDRIALPDGVERLEIEPGEIPALLGTMDIVIAGTAHEALDAMAAGRAVVGVGTATEVAAGIEDLPALIEDRGLRAARAEAGLATIAASHTDAAVDAYARLYAAAGAR